MFVLLGITRQITKSDILRYILLPQIFPRVRDLYKSGFSNLAYLIAQVYRGVRILPENHRIFDPQMRNHLTIRHVMAAAAAELQFNKKNIDKIIIYFSILAGIVLLIGQFLLMLGFLLVNPAFAGNLPTTYAQFFATPQYQTDIAYQMLFSVFGVPDLFNPGAPGNPYHTALHALFQFYSIGLLVVAVIIACYYIFAIVVETAQTGVPFGKRYNHVWAPIRLVVALGLLVPMGYGLNAAQWITLYAAKFGSDFATQGWVLFNQTMNQAYLNNAQERIGTPQAPDLTKLFAFMMTAQTCKIAYETLYQAPNQRRIDAYLVKTGGHTLAFPGGGGPGGGGANSNFAGAQAYYNDGDILIVFGEYDSTAYTKETGNVYPYCGKLVVSSADITEPGSKDMMFQYFNLLENMWNFNYQNINTEAQNFFNRYNTILKNNPQAPLPSNNFKDTVAQQLDTDVNRYIQGAVLLQSTSPTWATNMTLIQQLGWGGGGIWYNKIAQINGSLVQAVNNVPTVTSMPSIMEYIKARNLQQNMNIPNPFDLSMSDDVTMKFENTLELNIGAILNRVYSYWADEDSNQSAAGNQTRSTNNAFIDAINMVFGTRGLFNMCANTNTHPLAQLSILGKGMVEASIRNLATGFLIMIGQVVPGAIGAGLGAVSSMFTSIASITLTMGFLLFYVVPFMPFLYFFFAVGGWVKGLFEAMVGVPLWALAHLRIDGEGLPGDAAMDGYYLIFEIFLRPILIVFGLLASVIIFAAMVKVLNEIFTLVVSNLSGHDASFTQLCGQIGGGGPAGSTIQFFRGPIDEFFFTVLYAIIVYMIGMSCFKLIDLIPNNLLRYMGARVSTFNDTQAGPADGLMFKLSLGSNQVGGALIGIGRNAGTATTKGVQGVIESMSTKQ